MTKYKGLYFTPKLGVPAEAEITLGQNSMIIQHAEAREREWFYGMIRRKKSKDGSLRLVYESNPPEKIDFRDDRIVHEIKRLAPYTQLNELKPWWRSANGLYLLLAAKFGLVVVAVLLYFFFVPFMIDIAVNGISLETEKNLGSKIREGFFSEMPVDSTKSKEVNEILKELKLPANYNIHVSVLKSNEKNAFALPGGDIVIYSGIFNVMQNYPELVALLGHEIGHVENRHSMKLLSRQATSGILLMVALGNFSEVTKIIFSNANTFHRLSYNRKFEEEADRYGLDLMEINSIDPLGMKELFEHLRQTEKEKINIQFLSTHPMLQKRIDKISKAILEKKYSYSENERLSGLWNQIKKNEE